VADAENWDRKNVRATYWLDRELRDEEKVTAGRWSAMSVRNICEWELVAS
jgi:hypothetical protein